MKKDETKDEQHPELEVKRKMMEQRRDHFRQEGFGAELEIATFKIQKTGSPGEERQKSQTLKDLRTKADNCYASARELVRLLAELPEAPKESESA